MQPSVSGQPLGHFGLWMAAAIKVWWSGSKGYRCYLSQVLDVDPLWETWRRVEQSISSVIDHTTFAELARTWHDKQSKYVPNWEI